MGLNAAPAREGSVPQIPHLQILRAVAALMVAFGHAQHDALVQSLKLGTGFWRLFTLPWGAGVDLFFVISGFIMVYASERLYGREGAPAAFLGRRMARIVPLYWLFLTLYMAVTVQAAWAGTKPLPAALDILASYGFWPTDAFGDGIPRPLLTLGWTLNYEMFFYVVFALFVGFPRAKATLSVSLVLLVLVALGSGLSPASPALFFWTRPIVLEFCLGMGIAILFRSGIVLTPALRAAATLAALAILVADPLHSSQQALDWITPNDVSRLLGWGIPAALIVAAAVLGPQARPSRPLRAGIALGDASYALYLAHPFVIFGFRNVWLKANLDATLGLWPMVALSLILACIVALLVHRGVEKPLTAFIQRRLRERGPVEVASA